LLQAAQPGLVRRLRQLAIDFDALTRVRDIAEVLSIEPDGGGGYFIGFSGVPGSAYRLQRAPSLAGPWTTSAPQTAPASGDVEFWDFFSPPASGFYRAVQP
jgi:hypothetical protein